MKAPRAFCFFIFFVVCFSAFGQAGKALDSAVARAAGAFMGGTGHVGLSIGIIKNGKRYFYNYGTIDKERHVAPNEHTLYELASVTKTFTGILLAKAVADHKIKLDDDVQQYLDGDFSNLAFNGGRIKIVQLANHTSGLPKFLPGLDTAISAEENMRSFDSFSREDFLHLLQKTKIDTMPGTRFTYSNADAQLIGIILERLYHAEFGQLVNRFITGPLRMNDTKMTVSDSDVYRFANGYSGKGDLMPRLTWWRTVPAAGFLKSTTADMLSYLQFNLAENNPVISLAHRPTFAVAVEGADSIGLYWFIKKTANGQREIFHAGGSFGTTTFCLVCPALKAGIVCLANDASGDTERELVCLAEEIMTMLQ